MDAADARLLSGWCFSQKRGSIVDRRRGGRRAEECERDERLCTSRRPTPGRRLFKGRTRTLSKLLLDEAPQIIDVRDDEAPRRCTRRVRADA